MMTAGFYRKYSTSFARWDRDTSSWRTSQVCLWEDLDTFSDSWPRQGSMRSGECFPAPDWEGVTGEKESLSWATPAATRQVRNSPDRGPCLPEQSKQWPTPRARTEVSSGRNLQGGKSLKDELAKWPTPSARDWKSGQSNITHNARPLNEAACRYGHPDPPPTGPEFPKPTGRLNSRFVQWLMGFPDLWTSPTEQPDLRHWETQCRHLLQRWLGESYATESGGE
jgi:hypothetical protein